jgi:mono/diheme cytochrome c family protein
MATSWRLKAVALIVILTSFSSAGCAHRAASTRIDRGRGAALFAKNCLVCHGSTAESTRIGSSLAGEGRKKTLGQIVEAIKEPDPPMPKLYPGTLSEPDVLDIAAYVKTL